MTRYQKIYINIRSVLERLIGVVVLILFLPVFMGIILAIKLEDGWTANVFFDQRRVGKGKEHFNLYKFRSMKLDTPHDVPTHLLENPEQYITRVGKFLRKTSLDELPQLINIIRGDMSFVGPRPALWNQFDLIAERDKYHANDILPGLTGWAQINGRDELEIEEKAKLDGYYVKHVGPIIDFLSIVGTCMVLLNSESVVEGGTGAIKKKILIITNHSYMYWRFRKELTEELLKNYNIVISTPFEGHEEDLQKLGCRVIKTKMDRRGINPFKDFKLILFYNQLLRREKPGMVITYSIKPNVYAGYLCRRRHIPYCVNVQGLGTAFQKKGLSELVTVMYRKALKGASTVFFENEENARLFRERGIVTEEMQTVLSGAGINLDKYRYTEYPRNEKTHFLYLGRIMKEKGMDETFYAIRKLREKYGDQVVLDLVGFYEDSYKKEVEALVEEGTVVFHGFQTEPLPYYQAADCVVLASYHEGMSNVLLEAAAVGRPIIASDIPGCREAVEDGNSGLLCKVKNREDLYEKMCQFMELSPEQREAMGKAGHAYMERRFDKNLIIQETIKGIFK